MILNFRANTPQFMLPADLIFSEATLLICNLPVEPGDDLRALGLRPFEARAYLLH